MEAEIRRYVFAAALGDCEDLETPYELAVRLGVPEEKRPAFVERILGQILEVHQEMEDSKDVVDSGRLADDWDIESDLLEEAGRRGLA